MTDILLFALGFAVWLTAIIVGLSWDPDELRP
jgi:hypothetical protein